MKRQNWIEQDILEVKGMATNPVVTSLEFASRLLNVHVHERPGAVTLRPGYALKYHKPNNDNITGEFLNFGLFYDKEADPDGEEILCLVQKGELKALDNSGTPIVSDTLKGLWFWVTPHFDKENNGWSAGYRLANDTIITKILSIDGTYPNAIKIFGGVSHGLADGSLEQYSIWNKTKNETSQIITSKLDSGNLFITHTRYNNSWSVDDVLVIMKYYIKPEHRQELYNVKAEEIQFHNVLNDLRIGFGGKENRPGLSIGYRKKYLRLQKFDFNLHPDITAEKEENFAHLNDIVVTYHILNTDAFGLELTQGKGELEEGTYHIKVVGIIDGYEVQQIAEDSISILGSSSINIAPYINIGMQNPRITGYKIYMGKEDGLGNYTYYKLKDILITGDKYYDNKEFVIDENSKYLSKVDTSELHTEHDCAEIDVIDNQQLGNWVSNDTGVVSVALSDGYGQSSWVISSLKYAMDGLDTANKRYVGVIYPLNLEKYLTYVVNFKVKSNIDKKSMKIAFLKADKTISGVKHIGESKNGDWVTVETEYYNGKDDVKYIFIGVDNTYGRDIYLNYDKLVSFKKNGTGLTEYIDNDINIYKGIVIDNTIFSFGDLKDSPGNYLIYSSDDGGKTFSEVGANLDTTDSTVGLYSKYGNIYHGKMTGAVLLSKDKCKTWELLTSDVTNGTVSVTNRAINTIEAQYSYLYAGTVGGGVFRSENSGKEWVAKNVGLGSYLNIISILESGNDLTLCAGDGTNFHFFYSNDYGDTWVDRSTGLSGLIHDMIVDNTPGNVKIYISTEAGLYVSSDFGSTWAEIGTASTATKFYGLIKRDGVLYVATNKTDKIYYTNDDATWNEISVLLSDPELFRFNKNDNSFQIDIFSIKPKDPTKADVFKTTTNIQSDLGYTPDFNLVTGWDKAVTHKGRVYYLNPYIKQRYVNYLLVSYIGGNGAYMWDIASFGNYRELERFDSNKAMGMEVLSTSELIIIKDKSFEVLADDGLVGILREPETGNSCVSANSIVNISGLIVWAGNEDIYTYSPHKGLESVLANTIRNIYTDIKHKDKLTAIRDRYNTYRLRVYDKTEKTEYLFFGGFNVIEEQKYHFAEFYRDTFHGKLLFLSDGNIYEEDTELGYGKVYSGNSSGIGYGRVL